MSTHGFEIVREQEIPEIGSQARLLRHVKTGARLLSLENSDENKVFGVTFRTPPPDSTGVAHIMEHSVLGGSDKYPVKEPFVELIKGSLNTFLNAMTGPDKTMYPVASQNVRDLYNLVDVYLDAVFHPRITRHTLLQEGCHYVPDESGETLTYSGIVLNEMKGAYSSPDALAYRRSLQSLFPDTPCGHDSGGDPACIPDLTYEQFRAFHASLYHPSNAYVFWAGDDDPTERLRILDAVLGQFDRIDVEAEVPLQPRFAEPRRVEIPYDSNDEKARSVVTVNWLIGEDLDPASVITSIVLDQALIGTPASPLRKALIDSGLGEDLSGGGLNDSLREAIFSVGLRGIAAEDAGKVEAVIEETLRGIVRDGIDPAEVESALNTIEFRLRENNTGHWPPGLFLMMRALPAWVHGGDPFAVLAFEAPLAALRARLEAGERPLEDRIREGLVDNPHRTTVLLVPDASVRPEQEAAERDRLAAARAAMTDEDLGRVREDAAELERIQTTPDTPADLATIPSLALSDLDREGKTIPVERRSVGGCEALFHDIPTAGIVYLDLGFDLHGLSEDLVPLVPIFGRALLETGTAKEDHVGLARRIGGRTGGIDSTRFLEGRLHEPGAEARLFLRGKATHERAGELLDILRDVLLTARLDDRDRIGKMIRESRARIEAQLVPAGHAMARRRLGARYHEAEWLREQTAGVSQLFSLRRLADEVENDWPSVAARLDAIRSVVLTRNGLLANVTLDGSEATSFERELGGLIDALPAGESAPQDWSLPSFPAFEGLSIPARGNYVVKGANLRAMGIDPEGSAHVALNYLHTSFLWERIRARGGAYSAHAGYDRTTGTFWFLSYRDPHLLATLSTFDEAGRFLRDLDLDEEEVVRSIIGSIGSIDAPLLPDGRGWESMSRILRGESDEERQRRREQVLGTTIENFREFGEVLDRVAAEGEMVVVGSPEALDEAAGEHDGEIAMTKVL